MILIELLIIALRIKYLEISIYKGFISQKKKILYKFLSIFFSEHTCVCTIEIKHLWFPIVILTLLRCN